MCRFWDIMKKEGAYVPLTQTFHNHHNQSMIIPETPEMLAFDARIDSAREHLKQKQQSSTEDKAKKIEIGRYQGEMRELKNRIKAALDCPEELLQDNYECSAPKVDLTLYGMTISYSFDRRSIWYSNNGEWNNDEIPKTTEFGATLTSHWKIRYDYLKEANADQLNRWTGKMLAIAKDFYVQAVEQFNQAVSGDAVAEEEIKRVYASYWQNNNEWKPITLYRWVWHGKEDSPESGWATTDEPDQQGYIRILPSTTEGNETRYLKLDKTPFPVERCEIASLERLPRSLYTEQKHHIPFKLTTLLNPELEPVELFVRSDDRTYVLPNREIIPIPEIVELLG